MQKWEYLLAKPETFDSELIQQFLSDRGNEGWELVSVTEQQIENPMKEETAPLYTMFFKRPKQ
jgi:hypothetical protein